MLYYAYIYKYAHTYGINKIYLAIDRDSQR